MDALEFNKDIGDMNEAEARATLRDVRSKYSDAQEEFSKLQEEKKEQEEELDQYKEAAAEAHDFFAEKASEVKDMPKDTIKEKFTTEEIREDLLDDAEFHVGAPEEESEGDNNEFEDQPEKSDNLPGDGGSEWYEQEAEQAIEGITVQHDQI